MNNKIKNIFKTRKRKMREECWGLDYQIVKWLNEHLEVYLKGKNDFVDMTAYKFNYQGRVRTELELTRELLYTTEMLLSYYDNNFEINVDDLIQLKDKMYDILKLLHFNLGW